MKKIAIIVISLQVLFVMSSCNFDPYYGKRPFDYENAKWISEEPSAWFVVDRSYTDYYRPKGEVVLDNSSVQVAFRFVTETDIVFIDLIDPDKTLKKTDYSGYNVAVMGKCDFSPNKLIINIDPKNDSLFNGRYDTITFIKYQQN